MLTVIIAILVIGGTYYLLVERFATQVPLALSMSVALVAGLVMSLLNHLVLNRMFSARKGNMTFLDWNHLILVTAVTGAIILSLSQLVLTQRLPEPRMGHHLVSLALYLLMLGLSTFAHANWHRSRPESQ